MSTDEQNKNLNQGNKDAEGTRKDEQLSEEDLSKVTGGTGLTFGREKLKST